MVLDGRIERKKGYMEEQGLKWVVVCLLLFFKTIFLNKI